MVTTGLVGRESAVARLLALVEDAPRHGDALVVHGAAGVGKSALLAEASAAAIDRGMTVIRAAGVEAETRLPYAGLHRMLLPLLDRVADLPPPQRRALLTAFGMIDGTAPDLYLTALAALSVVTEEATPERPLLLLVDDVHWLDRSTADVLAFVARRLESEPVVLIAAVREGLEGVFDDRGLPHLRLDPLDLVASRALLDASAPGLPPLARERILLEAAGNPLALIELPVRIALDDDATTLPTWLPLTTRLEQCFAARYAELPESTRMLLLVAALNDGESLAEALAAAGFAIGDAVAVGDVGPAAEAQLVDVDEQALRFRHPLMRSAIRQTAPSSQRQAAHAALAHVLGAEPDRNVWHRAAASAGSDESVAAALEATASRARQRGAVDVAIAALVRAAELSAEPGLRAGRLLGAAELAVQQGRRNVVLALLAKAEPLDLTRRQRWWMVWIRESFDDGIHDVAAGARALVDLAEEVAADGDVDLALNLLWGAALRCFWSEPGQDIRRRVVAFADRIPVDPSDPRLLAILAYAAPIERGSLVVERLAQYTDHAIEDPRASYLLGSAATLVGASPFALSFSGASLDGLRSQGRLGVLVRALALRAWCAVHLANLAIALPAAAESARLAAETGQPIMRATARATEAMCAALRGDGDAVEAIIAEIEQESLVVTARPVLASIQIARGLVALGEGRYLDAFDELRRMHDPADPAFHIAMRCFAVGELAEAAFHGGRLDELRPILAEMEAVAATTSSPVLHAGLNYARALLADTEEQFLVALRAGESGWPFHRARILLAYGGWLRRHRRASESRMPLRQAREIFDALGTIPWGERARQELRASGETARKRVLDTRDHLTPQELQIARMAAEGLTNREIGERLYLSHRTVGSHLHHIYPKLGVSSRMELRAVIDAG